MTLNEAVIRAQALHDELRSIRDVAKRLAIDDMERWKLSIRADQITKDLKALTSQYRQGKTA